MLQPGPLSSVQPPPSFSPAASDGARHPNAAPATVPAPTPAPDYAASRAVLARENETNLQLSKEQLNFLHLLEMDEVSATITEICEFTGVSRATFYRWRTNPRFNQAFGECIARCVFSDLSIVLRNELQDAMTGDRKAGRHTLKLFLSGRGLQHYDAILSMLNSAGRNTPIPPNAGHADPNSPAPTPSQRSHCADISFGTGGTGSFTAPAGPLMHDPKSETGGHDDDGPDDLLRFRMGMRMRRTMRSNPHASASRLSHSGSELRLILLLSPISMTLARGERAPEHRFVHPPATPIRV